MLDPTSAKPLHAPPAGGDGAPALSDADRRLAQHRRKVRALTDDETGVRYASLALFADPLFALYDLDASAAFDLAADPDDADDTTVAVMEAARVLWAYYSLPNQHRFERRGALVKFLIGPTASPEDEADIDALLDAVDTHWAMLTDDDIAIAEDTDAPTLDFDALLDHPAFAPEPAPAGPSYGPDGLGEIEARALFSQPLLERVDDPDDLETAMARADDYWTLAQLRGVEHDAYLDEFVEANALDEAEAADLRREAERMTERFRTLFPEHA